MAVNSGRWGSKIGPRIAMLVVQGMVSTHRQLAALKHKIAMSVFHAISNEISDEVEYIMGPLISKIHDAIDETHPAYPLIHFMHTQRGQLKAIVGAGASMTGLLGAIGQIMNNELAPVAYAYVGSNPHLIPSVGDVASMAATGLIGPDAASAVIGSNGLDSGWAQNYLDLAFNYPSFADGLELVRRGLLSNEDMGTIFQRNGIPVDYWEPLIELRNSPVSVADAALGVLRGDITMNEGAIIAAQNGFTLESFNILVSNTGEPPGIMQMLEAFRRGFINEATLDRAILQSRVRDEWIPVIKQLRYTPMSVADAVNAVVQNHLTLAEGEKIANFNGLEPADFGTLYETAGEPLSRTEMEQLYNRGLVTKADVEQALRESRLKDKYIDSAFQLHQKIVPVFTLQRALRYGGISHADAIKIAMENGYSAADAALIVNAGSEERLQQYKNSVISATQALYEANIISDQDALATIVAMGYAEDEAKFIFEASEFRRNAKLINQVVNALKGKYLERHITRQQVINDLNAVGVPTPQRDNLMAEWDILHAANTKRLTALQLYKAVGLNLISAKDAIAELVYDGYSQADATYLISGAA